MSDRTIAAVAENRRALRDRGFVPHPLNGKIPVLTEWQKRTETSIGDIDTWATLYPHATNTGVLTKLTPAIDLDITVPDAAVAIEDLARGHFGERGEILVRFGKVPKRAILLRTDEPFEKMSRVFTAPDGSEQKIEILASGQQVVVAGIHPDTKKPYSWYGGEPWTTSRDALPYVREDNMRAFLDEAAQVLVDEHGFTDKGGSKQKTKANGAVDGEPRDRANWGELFARVHSGESLHDSITALAASFIASGMAESATIERLRSLMAASTAQKDERWRERYDDIPRIVRGAAQKFGQPDNIVAFSLDEWDAGDDPRTIPPRQWLLGNQFCCGFISSIVSAGGGGKSALRLLQFISLALGRSLCGQHVFRRCRVLLISLEDDHDEIQRRIKAVLDHYGIERIELQGWLFCATPKLTKLAQMNGNTRVVGPLERQLYDAILRCKPDIISLDPFIKTHALEENDSGDMDFVCDLLAKFAIEFGIAVDSPHHVHKGPLTPGDADFGRGSSGIRDAGRLIYTLAPMSEDEARMFGVAADDRGAYIRLDSAKVNIAARSTKPTWFRLIGVPIGNGTPEYPSGDTIQVVEPWSPPDTWAGVSPVTLNAILDGIDGGRPNGQRYSGDGGAKDRAAWQVVARHCPTKSEGQCREIIRTWLKTGLLYTADYDDPIDRKERKGLRVDATKRPSI